MSVTRLISAPGSVIEGYGPMELKESIYKSEGRVLCGQHFLHGGTGLVMGITNTELMFAFGADMVMLNTFDLEDPASIPGMCGLTLPELKALCRRPIGIYLGCPRQGTTSENTAATWSLDTTTATPEHVERAIELGADFLVLGGNPGTGTTLDDVLRATTWIKERYGDDVLVWAGKWEDGITEPVLGDPLAAAQGRDDKAVIARLIDAGADCIDLPAPGSRGGITVECIRELVTYVHSYKPGTLAMCFLNSSVEGSDVDTIREITLLMKQTGADIHCIGDGGFGYASTPENVHQMSVTLKGKNYTYWRMASVNR